MDWQYIANGTFMVAGFLIATVLKGTHDSIKELQENDIKLTDKVQAIELLVAGNYVKKSDMDKLLEAIFAKLDKIDAKLDRKMDR